MRSFRNGIKHMLCAVTFLTALFAMTLVLAGSASAIVTTPLGNTTVVQAPVGIGVNTIGVNPAINPLFRPAVNPLFRPAINPFFRPAAFNPFFRPAFLNPFLGVDPDELGLGLGIGVGIGAVGAGAVD